ncbi:MAG: hypothetical protein ACTHLA_10020 [Asticcacaulis sp.]|uniref:hypothetical protein n=1 Tax=Asticcacaulis sp. TaxID=1872648 RepID=UPI003F7B41E9
MRKMESGAELDYSLEQFWKRKLGVRNLRGALERPGWSGDESGLVTFLEAPLSHSAELTDTLPEESSIILVSAPGAVGKSTLARQISAATGAVYIDLAKAAPVGGDTISGGLAKTGLYQAWQAGEVALLIDGLDEARLRVTQEAFEAFLQDVADISKARQLPTVLFGRTGAVQDAWLILADQQVSTSILEIGFYDANAAKDFAMAVVAKDNPDRSHRTVEAEAVSLLLNRIREQTKTDGDRFAGYAPVLQAVARRVSAEKNVASLLAEVRQGSQPITLQSVVWSILDREHNKLSSLQFQDETLREKLYNRDEQLARLSARVFGHNPPDLPPMSAKDLETYNGALQSWVPDHPFLNGARDASSAVFDAVIVASGLKDNRLRETVLQRELHRGSAANPFLAEFYLSKDNAEADYVPSEHIGILYSSVRARLSLADTANLTIEGGEDDDGNAILEADVEITLMRGDRPEEQTRKITLLTDQTGTFRLGSYIGGMSLDIPLSKVEIGPGPEATVFAPINIQCDELIITAGRLFVEASQDKAQSVVYLAANKFLATQPMSPPILRGNVQLSVIWPGANSFPWTNFATTPIEPADPRIKEGLHRFRKFVTSFRSHSKGELARYSAKLEHKRMTKGLGQAILDHMKDTGIMTKRSANDPMYIMDADKLGDISGATYAQAMAFQFNDKTIEFVRQAVKSE